MMLENFNEIGKKYGRLTVIERAPNYKNGSAQWYCLCDCGNPNKIKVRASSLRDGHTKSCGCLSAETAKLVHTGKTVSKETKQKSSKSLSGQEHLDARSELGRKFPERGKYKRGSLLVRKINSFFNGTRQRRIECSLTKEQVANFIIADCFYCGKKSNLTGYKTATGIDRFDNSKGYIIGNCVPCCFHCNACKNERTIIEFIAHIRAMYNKLIESKEYNVKISY